MNRKRPKQIVIRATESELKAIQKKVAKAKITQNEYLLKSALEKEIIIVDGVADLNTELRRIGNNINQLTKAVHEGKITCGDELENVVKELKGLWQFSSRLCRRVET